MEVGRLGGEAYSTQAEMSVATDVDQGVTRLVHMASDVPRSHVWSDVSTDSVTFYFLELTDGRECWSVARRYSEFKEMHGTLVELCGQGGLPKFPPKKPVTMYFLESGKEQWKAKRQVALRNYLIDMLDRPGLSSFSIVRDFLRQRRLGAGSTGGPNESFFAGSVQISKEEVEGHTSQAMQRLGLPTGRCHDGAVGPVVELDVASGASSDGEDGPSSYGCSSEGSIGDADSGHSTDTETAETPPQNVGVHGKPGLAASGCCVLEGKVSGPSLHAYYSAGDRARSDSYLQRLLIDF